MAKQRRKKRDVEPNAVFAHLELKLAVIQHCHALKAVTKFLEEGKTEAAIARLDQTVSALLATSRGQCVGQTMKCPACGSEQDVVAWVDDGKCAECGEELELPKVTNDED